MGPDPDIDEVIAEVAAAQGMDAETIPDTVIAVGAVLLHEAMPLLRRSEFDSLARWLPVLADAFVEWARRTNRVSHEDTHERAGQSGYDGTAHPG
jgi:hypothetical protein